MKSGNLILFLDKTGGNGVVTAMLPREPSLCQHLFLAIFETF